MNKGIRDYCKFISTQVGSAANVLINVNKNDANMHINIPLYQSNGINPINLGLMYTLSQNNQSSIFGNGIQFNYYKRLLQDEYGYNVTNQDGSNDKYILNGTTNLFTNEETGSYISSESNNYYTILLDKFGNKYIYDTYYVQYPNDLVFYPKRIEYVNGFAINLTDNGSEILISNEQGETISIEYINGKVQKVVILKDVDGLYESMLELEFTYLNGYLTQILNKFFRNEFYDHITYFYEFKMLENYIFIKQGLPEGLTGIRTKFTLDSDNKKLISFKTDYNDELIGGTNTNFLYEDGVTTVTDYRNKSLRIFFDPNDTPIYEIDHKARVVGYTFNNEKKLINKTNIQNNSPEAAKKYSLIKNGYFEDVETFNIDWRKYSHGNNSGDYNIVNDTSHIYSDILGSNTLKISNSTSIYTSVYQTLHISGNPNDILTFIIWGKEIYTPTTGTEILAKATITLWKNRNLNEIVAREEVSFTKYGASLNSNPWEYRTIEIKPTEMYTSGDITITVSGLDSEYLFDAIQLYQKTLGTFIDYDSKGNLVSAYNGNQTNEIQYTENNLPNQILGTDSSLSNILYDDRGNIIMEEKEHGVVITNNYDNYNNKIKTNIKYKDTYFETSEEHLINLITRNYMLKNEDFLGNRYEYEFDRVFYQKQNFKDEQGNEKYYDYDNHSWNSLRHFDEVNGIDFSRIAYTYTPQQQIQQVTLENGSSKDVEYEYNYDQLGRLKHVIVGDNFDSENYKLCEYSYVDNYNNQTVYTNKIDSYRYGNTENIFKYDDDDRVKEIHLKKEGILETEILFKYNYDLGRLSKYEDVRDENNPKFIEYEYDVNDQLIKVIDNDNNCIQYEYDNLGEISKKSLLNNGKRLIQSYDHLYRSKGLSSKAFYEGFKHHIYPLDPIRKYSCFFNHSEIVNNTVQISLKASYKYHTQQGEIYDYAIPPIRGENLVPEKDEQIPCIDYSYTNLRLTYHLTTNSNLNGNETVMFWFKTNSSNIDNYLFSTGSIFTHNFIGVYINSNGKLVLRLVDKDLIIYDNCIVTTTSIKLNEWNFFSLSWNNATKLDQTNECMYELVLNDDYKAINNSTIHVQTGSNYDLNIGYYRNNLADLGKFVGKISALVFTNGYNLNTREVTNYYNVCKEYVYYRENIDGDIVTVQTSGTNLYNQALLNAYNVIPLNNSFNSINGVKPNNFTIRQPVCYDKDRTFEYNNIIKRYAYVADGEILEYYFGLKDKGTLALKVFVNGKADEQYVFQNKDVYGKTLGLFRENDKLYVQVENEIYPTDLTLSNNVWTLISFSWSLVYDNDPEMGTTYYFSIRCGSSHKELNVNTSFKYSYFYTSIGRRRDLRQGQYADALLGQIEMLIYKDTIISPVLYNNLKYQIKVNTIAKQYDAFGLLKKETLSDDGDIKLDHTYIYKTFPNDNNRLKPQIDSENIISNLELIKKTYSYEQNGYVSNIKENDVNYRSYTYGYLGRLESEELCDENTSIFYQYIGNGNLDNKRIYSGNQIVDQFNFLYDPNWKDRLIKFGSKDIEYNDQAIGNPTFYGNGTLGINFTWEGRNLVRYYDNVKGLKISYTYNDEGLRVKKEVEFGPTTDYYYEGSKLISEISGTTRKDFLYDETGKLYGLIYNNFLYYYIRDILGNILGLVDIDGNIVVKYEYDAFGNLLSTTGTFNDNGRYNPFIYKGYYYDVETSLYYCKSRYYVPEWGRWLNADDVSYLEPTSVNGLNLYAYCGNNPVMNIDPNGNAWWNPTAWNWDKIGSVAKDVGLVLAAVGAVVLVTAAVTLTAGAAAYVILGAAAQTTIAGVMIGAAVGGSLAGTINMLGQASKIESMADFNFGSLMIDTFAGSAYGAISGFGGAGASLGTKIGVGIAKIGLSALSTGLHGLNDGKSASQIWGDVGKATLFSLGTQVIFIGGGTFFKGGSSGLISKLMNNQLLVSSGIIVGTGIYNNWIN